MKSTKNANPPVNFGAVVSIDKTVVNSCVFLDGFENTPLATAGLQVRFQGLGGNKNIRGYWNKYFDVSHAFIFVVDGSDTDRLVSSSSVLVASLFFCLISKLLRSKKAEAKEAFKVLAFDYRVANKPLLVLSNKQDLNESGLHLIFSSGNPVKG